MPVLDRCDPERAAEIIARALAGGEGWLGPADVSALLGCYGLPLIATRVVANAERGRCRRRRARRPGRAEGDRSGLLHKSDAGGVRLGLDGPLAVRAAALEIEAAVSGAGHSSRASIVQPMAEPGVELLVGVVHDESFGPVVACGAGGTSVELLHDAAVRITPLTDLDAGGDAPLTAHLPAARGLPRARPRATSPRWKMCSCASARSSRPIPRSPSSTPTRSWPRRAAL